MIAIIQITFAAVCSLALIDRVINNKVLHVYAVVIFSLACIIIAGTRDIGVDQDSLGYLVYYNLDDGRMSLAAEPSFVFLSGLTRSLFGENGFRALLIVYSVMGVSLKIYAIRKLSTLFWLSAITYFCGYYILHEMTQVRAGVASAFLLISVYFIIKKRPIEFLLSIGMASIFHYSAMLALPTYFLSRNIGIKLKVLMALSLPVAIIVRDFGLNIAYIIPIELVRSKIDIYTTSIAYNEVQLNIFNMVYLVKYLMLYLFIFLYKSDRHYSTLYAITLQFYAISMFLYIALSYNATFSMRVSEMFGIVEIILFPMLYFSIGKVPGTIAVLVVAAGNMLLGLYHTELLYW